MRRALSLVTAFRPTVCAWCPGFNPFEHVAGTSHGMCQACSDRLIFDAMQRALRLAAPAAVVELPVDELPDEREELVGSQCGRACGFCGRCS